MKSKTIKRIIMFLVLILLFVLFVFPFIMVIINVFKVKADITADPLALIGKHGFTLNNFPAAIKKMNFWNAFRNSVIITCFATIGTIIFSVFREKGFDNVTVTDICDACEITKTTFYRYLSSKEDTLTYFFDSLNDELGDIILDLASAENHWQQIVSAFALILNRIQHFDRDLYARLWITNLKNYHGTFDEIPILKSIVTVLIKKAQDSGQIHNTATAEDLYLLCSDICFGCSGKWAMGLNSEITETFARDLAVALCADSKVLK